MDNNQDSCSRPNFAYSHGLCTTTQPYDGSLSPTTSDWPAFELNDTCASTPLSLPVTPFISSRNCFDDNFQTALPMEDRFISSYDEFVAGTVPYQLDAPQAWDGQKESPQTALSYTPKLVFETNPTYSNFVPNHDIDLTALRSFPAQLESHTGRSYETHERSPKPKQGDRKYSTKKSSARKTKDGTGHGGLVKKEQRRRSSGHASSSRPPHQLRSTKNTQKVPNVKLKPTAPREAFDSQTSNTSRASHNLVEKQYRNRLNDQFNTLLSAIPSEVIKQEITGYVREDGPERRVSKAEVLVLAKKHIQTLEMKNQCLEEEREGLKGTVKKLKGAWVNSGGCILP